tara:strand:- start:1909 stop:2427 length:519 start_codon:yes stop_codon:yes gene_type:complete
MNYQPIPSYLKEYADALTLLRVEINRKRYKGTHKQRTGTKNSKLLGEVEREYYTEYLGILGELLVRNYYETNPEFSSYKASTFIKGARSVKDDSDLIVVKNGVSNKISIKTCEYSFKANCRAMDKETSDIVVFLLFISPDEYVVANYTPNQVKNWEVRHGYSPYYELHPTKK